jgi:3-polyprenyl-4-hydroxybenzoate decarboxylase
MSRDAIALAMTGASGVVYGLRLLECLLQAHKTVYLMLSPAAHIVLAQETDLKVTGERFECPAGAGGLPVHQRHVGGDRTGQRR